MVTNPKGGEDAELCREWLKHLLSASVAVRIPDICDYEVRRELLRAQKTRGLERLDQLGNLLERVQVTTDVLIAAAEFWAAARRGGRPTAGDGELDADMILCAQAKRHAAQVGLRVVIATTNVGHLARFADARNWQELKL